MAKPMLFKALENQWGTASFKEQDVIHFAEGSLKLSKNNSDFTKKNRTFNTKLIGSGENA